MVFCRGRGWYHPSNFDPLVQHRRNCKNFESSASFSWPANICKLNSKSTQGGKMARWHPPLHLRYVLPICHAHMRAPFNLLRAAAKETARVWKRERKRENSHIACKSFSHLPLGRCSSLKVGKVVSESDSDSVSERFNILIHDIIWTHDGLDIMNDTILCGVATLPSDQMDLHKCKFKCRFDFGFV